MTRLSFQRKIEIEHVCIQLEIRQMEQRIERGKRLRFGYYTGDLRIESLLSFAFMNLMNDVLKHSSCAEMRVQRHPTAGGEGAL